jgi:hypothetical protein
VIKKEEDKMGELPLYLGELEGVAHAIIEYGNLAVIFMSLDQGTRSKTCLLQ